MEIRDKAFFIDGREFLIRGGTLHYFRTLPAYWDILMKKYRAAGLNTLETYCCWNLHEPRKGEFCFSGALLQEENEIVVLETDGLKGAAEVIINAQHGLTGKPHEGVTKR